MADMMETLALVAGSSAGTAALGVVGSWVRGRLSARKGEREAEAREHIADAIHDERVAPRLLVRVEALESRIDARDDQIRAALFADPADVDAWERALRALDDGAALAALASQGRENAARWSIERDVDELEVELSRIGGRHA